VEPLSAQQVLALAPDSSSASAGQGLASLKKWVSVGRSERAVWGLCQGSGKDPYQARVDVAGPAFKCTCPSRKFPCKHGLGLMLAFAGSPAAFKVQEEPGWVSEWLLGRAEKEEKKVEKAKVAAEKPVDLEAQAKRAARRDERVKDGIAGCRLWLDDLMRRGLAAARSEAAGSWEQMAARMVDAQAPGLAGHIRRMPEILASGDGWDVRTLDAIGRLHLLVAAAEKMESLPPDLMSDVRAALGYNQPKEEVLATAAVADRWAVVGQVTEDEDRLRVRRTWLVGRKTARRALVLDFAAGTQPLDTSLVAGVEFDGEIVYYPSRAPMRALIKTRGGAAPIAGPLADVVDATIEAGLRRYTEALAQVPWTFRWPIVLSSARVAAEVGKWHLIDSTSRGLPIRPAFAKSLQQWRMVSAAGGGLITAVGEWDGEYFLPVSALGGAGGTYQDLAPRWAA
jgi:hypothetical protein